MAGKKKKKKERKEKIETAEVLGDIAEEVGVEDVLTGAEDLAAAGELEEASKEALAAGAAEVTCPPWAPTNASMPGNWATASGFAVMAAS